MDATRFDRLARTLASGVSRRVLLRGLAAGVVASFYSRVSLRAATPPAGTCSGVTYDPQTQCCVLGAVRQKHPIDRVAFCPDRVAHPGHVPVFNGCGSGFFGGLVPNRFRAANFKSACNAHDLCYEDCSASQDTCDINFLNDLLDQCLAAYPPSNARGRERQRQECEARAQQYYTVVSGPLGRDAYEIAQSNACDCCPGDCGECGPCDDCVDGSCLSRCTGDQTCEAGICVTPSCASSGPWNLALSQSSTDLSDIYVDDDVRIYLNGAPIFLDQDEVVTRFGPIYFTAGNGDTLQVIAEDVSGGCRAIESIYVHRLCDGATQQLISLRDDGCNDFPPGRTVFLDTSVTINF